MKSNIDVLKEEIRADEGKVLDDDGLHIVYPGPKTKKPHIAFGHLLGQQQSDDELRAMGLEDEPEDWFTCGLTLNDDQAEELLHIDIFDAIEGLHSSKRYPGWTEEELLELDSQRFIALMNMAFQLGGPGVRMKFPSFVKAVHAEDWERAADEMIWSNGLLKQKRSQWYIDTPHRAQAMSDKMRYGSAGKPTESDPIGSLTEAETPKDDFGILELTERMDKEFATMNDKLDVILALIKNGE